MTTKNATDKERDQIFKALKNLAANKMCIDCRSRNPTWAAVAHGVYICLDCSSLHRNAGVHITFVRSTNLDIWSWAQLRTMKVGGNAAFLDFMARHPGSPPFGADTKDKYGCRNALLYKEELAKRSKVDEQQFGIGGKVFVEGMSSVDKVVVKSDTDFFDTWDSPTPPLNGGSGTGGGLKAPLSLNPLASSSAPNLISFGRSPGNTPLNSRPASPRIPSPSLSVGSLPPTSSAPTGPRTVTSSSLRTATTSNASTRARPSNSLGGVRTPTAGSSSLGAGSSSSSSSRGKLGVKKVVGVNFEEASKKAQEEEERIKQLSYDTLKEQEASLAAAAARKASFSTAPTTSTSSSGGGSTGPSGSLAESAQLQAKRGSIDTERLGMGLGRLGFGQASGVSGEQSAKNAAAKAKAATRKANGYDDEAIANTDYARKTFGNQKGISSDQYHQTGAYDANAAKEAQSRLASFNGATSISSNQYYGRDEDDQGEMEESVMEANGLGGLESTAKAAVLAIMEQTGIEDVEGLQSAIRSGAMKLSDMLAKYA